MSRTTGVSGLLRAALLLVFGCVSGQILPEQDCTRDGGPDDVSAQQLRAAAQGRLSDASFLVFSNGNLVSPELPVAVTLGQNHTIGMIRQGGDFQGYLVRVSTLAITSSFTFFVKDAFDVGTVAFCSALGVLDASNIDVAPQFPLEAAGVRLFFDGSSSFQVSVQIIAATTAGAGEYEYYFDEYILQVDPGTQVPTTSPTQQPTKAPTTQPTKAPTLSPTNSPTKAPTVQPTKSPTTSPTKSPTTSPTTSPTKAPVVIIAPVEPTEAPTKRPTTAPSTSPTRRPTAQPNDLPTTPNPTSAPTKVPTSKPSKAPNTPAPTYFGQTGVPSVSPTVAPTKAPTTASPTRKPVPSTSPPSLRPATETPPTQISELKTEKYTNLQMTLGCTPELDEPAQRDFEQTTEEWYRGVYQNRGRLRRFLQEQGIFDFDTKVDFRSQAPNGKNNTVAFDQSLSWRESGESVDPLSIIQSPFENRDLSETFYADLRASNPTFENATQGPDESRGVDGTFAALVGDEPAGDDSGGNSNFLVVVVLAAVAGVLTLGLFLIFVNRRRKGHEKHEPLEKDEVQPVNVPPPTTELVVNEDEVSALYTPSLSGLSYDAEQSMSTVDYDYAKVASGGENRSIVSSAGGTLGEHTRQDSLTQTTPMEFQQQGSGRWAKLGTNYNDQRNIYHVPAPAGKLGVVVDTPDEGPPVIHAVKDTSVLSGKVQVGDRLLAVDDDDVTSMSAVNISRLISKKADAHVRNFTLMRPPNKSGR